MLSLNVCCHAPDKQLAHLELTEELRPKCSLYRRRMMSTLPCWLARSCCCGPAGGSGSGSAVRMRGGKLQVICMLGGCSTRLPAWLGPPLLGGQLCALMRCCMPHAYHGQVLPPLHDSAAMHANS